MLTSCGSEKISVKIVDSFCESKYYPQKELTKKDLDNLDKMRADKEYQLTLDKLISHLTVNEKEYQQCQNLANNQPQN